MLIINCTKAATEFFSKTRKGEKTSPVELPSDKKLDAAIVQANFPGEWQWMVHAVKVKAKNVLVAMDYNTRFSISLSELKKGDPDDFINRLEHHLIVHVHELMRNIDADNNTIENSIYEYQKQYSNLTYYARGDRSVQSNINDVVWHFRQHTSEIDAVPTGVHLISQDVFVNHTLRKRKTDKEYFYPHHEFLRQWLIHFAHQSEQEAHEGVTLLHEREKSEVASRHPALFEGVSETPRNLSCANTEAMRPNRASNVVYLEDFRKKN